MLSPKFQGHRNSAQAAVEPRFANQRGLEFMALSINPYHQISAPWPIRHALQEPHLTAPAAKADPVGKHKERLYRAEPYLRNRLPTGLMSEVAANLMRSGIMFIPVLTRTRGQPLKRAMY
jgi:hypothetical protein